MKEIIKKIIETSDATVRIQFLEKLLLKGIAERGSILPRGTLSRVAKARLKFEEEKALGTLLDPKANKEIFLKIAAVLGEFGGEDSVEYLRKILDCKDLDNLMIQSIIGALQILGGETSARTLLTILERIESADVQFLALSAIEILISGGNIDISDPTPKPRPTGAIKISKGNLNLERKLSAIKTGTKPEFLIDKAEEILKMI